MKFSRVLCIVTTTMVSLSSTSFAQTQNTPGLRGGEGFPRMGGRPSMGGRPGMEVGGPPGEGEGGFPRRACMRKCMNMTGWEKPEDWEKPDFDQIDFDEVDSPRRECMRKCKNMTGWEKPDDWERPDFGQDGFPRRRFRDCMRKCKNRTEWEKPEDWEKPDFDEVDLGDVDSPRRACIRKCKNMTEWEKPEDWEMPGGWERPKFGEGDRPFMRKPGLDDPEVGESGEEVIPSPPEADEGV